VGDGRERLPPILRLETSPVQFQQWPAEANSGNNKVEDKWKYDSVGFAKLQQVRASGKNDSVDRA
jgi:hypothetical protein